MISVSIETKKEQQICHVFSLPAAKKNKKLTPQAWTAQYTSREAFDVLKKFFLRIKQNEYSLFVEKICSHCRKTSWRAFGVLNAFLLVLLVNLGISSFWGTRNIDSSFKRIIWAIMFVHVNCK